MAFPELVVFAEECAAADQTLALVVAEQWDWAGLGEWTIAELVAHMVRGVTRIAELDLDPKETPAFDRVSYFEYDARQVSPEVAERARRDARKVAAASLPALFASGWRSSMERAGTLSPEHAVTTIRGPMRL